MKTKTTIKLITAIFMAAVMVAPAATAWGPARPTFTVASPAPHITFNSITDAEFGDERNFVLVRGANEGPADWRSRVDVRESGEYIIRIFVHNNAADGLGLVATGTRIASNVPQYGWVNRAQVDGLISADNASPRAVWSHVVFASAERRFQIEFIAGSAVYYNNSNLPGGTRLPDSIISPTGTLIGYGPNMDGNVPGCFQYSGYALYRVRITVEDPETPYVPGEEEPETPPVTGTPEELPTAGPAELALSIMAVLAITVGFVYWHRSNEALKKATVGGRIQNLRDKVGSKLDSFENKTKKQLKRIKSKFTKKK